MRLLSTLAIAACLMLLATATLGRVVPALRPFALALEGVAIVGVLITWNRLLGRYEQRELGRERIYDYMDTAALAPGPAGFDDRTYLARWLALAGQRGPEAPARFVLSTAAFVAVGLLANYWLARTSVFALGLQYLEEIPGGAGELFAPALRLGPWIVLVALACIPLLRVRAARRRVVTEVEQDLPLVLDLLATLSEAGLGFDAAIARIVSTQPPERTLTAELRTFQREMLTGRARVESLRRLARRVDVPSLTIFVSAVAHAEQVGAGVASVLRRQAEDTRNRRRDRALTLAQALPIKLQFPLVICFFPAIAVVTLGPLVMQFVGAVDAVITRRALP
jgi:tight adherence protein C